MRKQDSMALKELPVWLLEGKDLDRRICGSSAFRGAPGGGAIIISGCVYSAKTVRGGSKGLSGS